jgi:hypothetical protein
MRDDHSKQIEELKDKTNHTEQFEDILSTSPITVKKQNSIYFIKFIHFLVNNK